MQQTHSVPAGVAPLGSEDLLDIYAAMVRIRALDERVWILNRQGKAAIVASCQGHEAAQLGSVWALRRHAASHFCFTYYRDMGVCVAQGLTVREVMLGYLAKDGEPMSNARQFPLHGADVQRGFMNLSNVVGSQVPEAVGWALAAKIRRQPTVVAVYFGDGAASQGDVHESMNFASVHNLPVIFLVENNGYAISVPLHKQMAVDRVAERASAYGMPGVTVDGTDVTASYAATAQAVLRAAAGGGPSLVEFDVERYLPHTSDDDDSTYRPREEVDEGKKRDPLASLQQRLLSEGALTPARDAQLRKEARQEVDDATDFAEAAPYPSAAGILDHLYAPTDD